MGGRASRIKGHKFERDVAKDLRKVLNLTDDEVKRGLQSRNNIDEVPDVICPGFSIECKSYKKNPPVLKAFRQAQDVAKGKIPVAIVKEDFKPPIAVISYETFLQIIHTLNQFAVMVTELGKTVDVSGLIKLYNQDRNETDKV